MDSDNLKDFFLEIKRNTFKLVSKNPLPLQPLKQMVP